MKVERLTKTDEGFKPITIKLTIESKEELLDLWGRIAIQEPEWNEVSGELFLLLDNIKSNLNL